MFIRAKTRKNSSGNSYKYAYLVSNKYRKKGPKQKVKKYLGRIYNFEKAENKLFLDHINEENMHQFTSKNTLKKAITELIKLELLNHGFKEETSSIFKNKEISVDLNNLEATNKQGKNTYLAFNDGFLGKYTLSKLMKYKPPEAIDKEIGRDFLKKLVSAGILLDTETFLALFSKLKQEIKQSSKQSST